MTLTIILPIFVCSENVVRLILLHIFFIAHEITFIMEANTMNPDQTAPFGCKPHTAFDWLHVSILHKKIKGSKV